MNKIEQAMVEIGAFRNAGIGFWQPTLKEKAWLAAESALCSLEPTWWTPIQHMGNAWRELLNEEEANHLQRHGHEVVCLYRLTPTPACVG